MKKRILFLFVTLALLANQVAFATNTVKNLLPGNGQEISLADVKAHTLTKAEAKAIQKAEKKQVKSQKKMALFQKMFAKNMAKKAIDFKDPVNKWLWFAVFGWGAAVVLSIIAGAGSIGGIWILSSLAWLFGTVAFVIWLVKKFGN